MGRATLRRALGVLAVGALSGCSAPAPAAEERCGEPLQVEPGEVRTVLRADWFDDDASVGPGAALPDGSVLVMYDTNPDEAGDADDLAGEKPEPGLAVLRPDGSCAPFDLPEVDGRRLAPDARPVAVDDEDRLYLWDVPTGLLARGPLGGDWEKVTTVPFHLLRSGGPDVTVGEDGTVFISTGYAIYTVTAERTLEIIAGTGEEYRYETDGPLELPARATSTAIPAIHGLSALPSGGLVLSGRSSLYTLEDGVFDRLADADSTAGQEGAFSRYSSLGTLASTPEGDVLIDNAARKRLLLFRDGRSTVFLQDSSYLSMPDASPFLADGTGLVLYQNGGRAIAVYGLGHG